MHCITIRRSFVSEKSRIPNTEQQSNGLALSVADLLEPSFEAQNQPSTVISNGIRSRHDG